MATTVTPPHTETASIEQRVARLERTSVTAATTLTASGPKGRFRILLEFIGVGALVGAIFFLGTMYSTVNATAVKVDKLTEAIMSPSKDSLSSRMAVVETRLTSIEAKLDAMDKKLDRLAEK